MQGIYFYIKPFLLSPILLVICISTTAQEKDAAVKPVSALTLSKGNSITITGNIKRLLVSPNSLDSFTFQYKDLLTNKTVIVPVNKDSAGNFVTTIPLSSTQQLYLSQSWKYKDQVFQEGSIEFLFYARPGENMEIDYYLSKNFETRTIKFKGSMAGINSQDRDYQDKLDHSEFSPLINFKRLDSVKPEGYPAYKQYVSERLKAGLAYNAKYFADAKASSYLREQCDIDMRYTAANMLRDLYVTRHLSEAIGNDGIATVKPLINTYKNAIKFGQLKEQLMTQYNAEYKKVYERKLSARSILNNAKMLKPDSVFAAIVDKHKGKMIYVDVWATWCKPCLDEMENSRLLREKLTGHDVVFVYLCISSQSESQWKSLIASNQIEGQNYFLDQEQTKALVSHFKITGIPRYLIVGKDGKLKNEAASRPGKAETFEALSTKL